MANKKIQEYISEWMEELKENYELSRCEFVKEGSTWFLRVYADKLENGEYGYMTSDDCEVVSRFLSAKLDEADPISQNYYLEVSSPGMDRPLLSQKDFDRFTGELVDVKLYEGINGKKVFTAKLLGLNEGILKLQLEDEKLMEIPKEKVAKVNLSVVF